jgi:hypothetical protein
MLLIQQCWLLAICLSTTQHINLPMSLIHHPLNCGIQKYAQVAARHMYMQGNICPLGRTLSWFQAPGFFVISQKTLWKLLDSDTSSAMDTLQPQKKRPQNTPRYLAVTGSQFTYKPIPISHGRA